MPWIGAGFCGSGNGWCCGPLGNAAVVCRPVRQEARPLAAGVVLCSLCLGCCCPVGCLGWLCGSRCDVWWSVALWCDALGSALPAVCLLGLRVLFRAVCVPRGLPGWSPAQDEPRCWSAVLLSPCVFCVPCLCQVMSVVVCLVVPVVCGDPSLSWTECASESVSSVALCVCHGVSLAWP